MVRSAGLGNYVDDIGLMLRVGKGGTHQWIQRLCDPRRRVDLGLGSADCLKPAEARKVAADNRAIVRTGGDPRRSRMPTFRECRGDLLLGQAGHVAVGQPREQLALRRGPHVLPKIGGVPVDRVRSTAVYEVLRPIGLAGKHALSRWRARRSRRCGVGADFGVPLGGLAGEGCAAAAAETHRGPKHHDAVHWSKVCNSVMTQALRTSGIAASGHGFRSSFKL